MSARKLPARIGDILKTVDVDTLTGSYASPLHGTRRATQHLGLAVQWERAKARTG